MFNAYHHSAAFPGKTVDFVWFIKSEKSCCLPLQLEKPKSRTVVRKCGRTRHAFMNAAELDENLNFASI